MCGAPTHLGTICRNVAGLKTDHPGIGACHYHGGATPNASRKAARVKAEIQMREEMADRGEDPNTLRTVTPEEAIQWLLDTGLMRAQKWEDALQQWNSMRPVERNAIVTLSMAERNSLMNVAGLARRTGYHPHEQMRQFSNLVVSALQEGLERSGLEDLVGDHPWLGRAIDDLQSGVVDVLQRAEQEARGSSRGSDRAPLGDIDGTARDVTDGRLGGYDEWSLADLRDECSERGLRRGGTRTTLIAKLMRDDGRPEDKKDDKPKPLFEQIHDPKDRFTHDGHPDVIDGTAREIEPDETDEPDEG